MATFYNQATLSYNGGVTNSNITTGELLEVISATKTAITTSYGAGDSVVYVVSIVNSGATAITGITVTDNLGAYTSGTTTVYPLDYVTDSVRLYVNGVLETAPTVTVGPPLAFSGITVPAGASALLVYEARANEFAPLDVGDTITNTATVDGGGIPAPIEVTATVDAQASTSLTIAKAICPDTVVDNGELTYTFIIQNSGNTAADATAGIVISDTFNPILTGITVTLNGETMPATDYTYDETTGVFTTTAGAVTVPGATYTTDPVTGAITTTPGVATLTINGTV